jgi:hypothetical protein
VQLLRDVLAFDKVLMPSASLTWGASTDNHPCDHHIDWSKQQSMPEVRDCLLHSARKQPAKYPVAAACYSVPVFK